MHASSCREGIPEEEDVEKKLKNNISEPSCRPISHECWATKDGA